MVMHNDLTCQNFTCYNFAIPNSLPFYNLAWRQDNLTYGWVVTLNFVALLSYHCGQCDRQ